MGVLYGQISPTVLGYNARTLSTNQEFILLSLENVMEDLASSPVDSQTRVNVISNGAVYDVSNGKLLEVGVYDGGNNIVDSVFYQNIGLFSIDIDGSFQYETNDKHLSRVVNEDSLLQGDSTEINTNFVSKVHYEYDSAHFEMYPRSRVDIVEISTDVFIISITIVKIYYITYNGGSPMDFPVEDEEFTLRLRRMPTQTTEVSTLATPGPFTIRHSIDAINSATEFQFGSTNNVDVTVRYNVIPILFSI